MSLHSPPGDRQIEVAGRFDGVEVDVTAIDDVIVAAVIYVGLNAAESCRQLVVERGLALFDGEIAAADVEILAVVGSRVVT
jgi:hypothetical protein